MTTNYSIKELIGGYYSQAFLRNFKGRYRLYKTARNAKKSYNLIGIEILSILLSDERENVLIIRNTCSSNRQSTFSLILNRIYAFGISRYFKVNQNEMTITYKPTGQVILFRGCDDPQKIASITVVHGYLTRVYVEEAFEIDDYEQWRIIDGSIRGKLPDGLFHQITFLFNSWNKNHWLYEKFYKGRLEDNEEELEDKYYQEYRNEDEVLERGKGVYLFTGSYKINEFRDKENYDLAMENLKQVAPDIYRVEALGMWGNSSEGTYPEFNEKNIIDESIALQYRYCAYAIGIDTGLSNGQGKSKGDLIRYKSATTMQLVGLTADYSKLVCLNEFFHSNTPQNTKTEIQLCYDIVYKLLEWQKRYEKETILMKGKILCYVDCADIGFRDNLTWVAQKLGLNNVEFLASTKISIQTRVDYVRLIMAWQDYLVSKECPNLIREIRNSRRGEDGRPREDFDDHAINANEYAWQPLYTRMKRWRTFKVH